MTQPDMDNPNRRWYDYQGNVVTLPPDVPLTMYNGLNHQITVWQGEQLGQMLTKCGIRACPYPGLRTVPGRGTVDCPECLAAMGGDGAPGVAA